jgi:hypothetical protein
MGAAGRLEKRFGGVSTRDQNRAGNMLFVEPDCAVLTSMIKCEHHSYFMRNDNMTDPHVLSRYPKTPTQKRGRRIKHFPRRRSGSVRQRMTRLLETACALSPCKMQGWLTFIGNWKMNADFVKAVKDADAGARRMTDLLRAADHATTGYEATPMSGIATRGRFHRLAVSVLPQARKVSATPCSSNT